MALLADTIVLRYLKSSYLLLLGISLLQFSCQTNSKEVIIEKEILPFYNTAEFDAAWIKETDPGYSQIHSIDTFSLTNQLGHKITNDSLNGFIYVANFFFTSCTGICPKMIGNLKVLQGKFAGNRQIKLVSFSVMPWVDSVNKLKYYGSENDIDPNRWYLLTGSKERIYALGRQSYFAEKGLGLKKDNSKFLHTESMLLVDRKGRIRGIYNATQKVDIVRVTEDIETLLKE